MDWSWRAARLPDLTTLEFFHQQDVRNPRCTDNQAYSFDGLEKIFYSVLVSIKIHYGRLVNLYKNTAQGQKFINISPVNIRLQNYF